MTKRLRTASRHHIILYDEDWDFLEKLTEGQTGTQISVSQIIRQLVHKRVKELRVKLKEPGVPEALLRGRQGPGEAEPGEGESPFHVGA